MAKLVATNLSLSVPVYSHHEEASGAWVKAILGAALLRPDREDRTLIEGISFDLRDGDRFAIIGRNGAGKTTLLRMLAGAYWPTGGTLEVQGERHALMNLSLGFNADATLLENIYLRATAMGIRIRAIQPHIASILDFADLTSKATDRLKTLSAGQKMRLGFSISTAMQPDIMLLDEWIGTGDAEFLRKAKSRLHDRLDASRIVIVASHNLKLIRRLCNRAVLLDGGRMVSLGTPAQVIADYHAVINGRRPAPDAG